jgi:hypothetical protein
MDLGDLTPTDTDDNDDNDPSGSDGASVIPMSPSHSQVCLAPQNWAYTVHRHPVLTTPPPLRTRSTGLTLANPLSSPPRRPLGLIITCQPFNFRTMLNLTCLHRLIRPDHNITLLVYPQTG